MKSFRKSDVWKLKMMSRSAPTPQSTAAPSTTTRIRRGAKIDNLVHIGHNCQIGEDVVIAAQTGLSGSITIEKNVVLGGQVGIGEHARIEEGVMLGGQGGVLPNKILRGKGIAFWGTPAKPVREYLKELAALARLARKK